MLEFFGLEDPRLHTTGVVEEVCGGYSILATHRGAATRLPLPIKGSLEPEMHDIEGGNEARETHELIPPVRTNCKNC